MGADDAQKNRASRALFFHPPMAASIAIKLGVVMVVVMVVVMMVVAPIPRRHHDHAGPIGIGAVVGMVVVVVVIELGKLDILRR